MARYYLALSLLYIAPRITEIEEIKKYLTEKLEKIKNVSPPTSLINQIKKDVKYYRILQQIKEYIDKLDFEEIEKLKKKYKIHYYFHRRYRYDKVRISCKSSRKGRA